MPARSNQCLNCQRQVSRQNRLCLSCYRLHQLKTKRSKDQKNLATKLWRQKVKDETFAAYGGYICRCCGEDEPIFLVLDHINNDGNIQRKSFRNGRGRGSGEYWHLKKSGFPQGLQVLCHNCNYAKSNGGCPHACGVRKTA